MGPFLWGGELTFASFQKRLQRAVLGLDYCHSMPPCGFTASTLERFCPQYAELQYRGVFQAQMMMLISTRWFLLKEKKDILHRALIFLEPSQKNLIRSTYVKKDRRGSALQWTYFTLVWSTQDGMTWPCIYSPCLPLIGKLSK